MADHLTTRRRMAKSFDQLVYDEFGPGSGWSGDAAVAHIEQKLIEARHGSSAQLNKALGIADGTGIGNTTALHLENLDATMTEVLLTQKHLRVFNSIPRKTSPNIYYEWNRRQTYGSARGHAGFREGGAPNGAIPSWARDTAQIRFLGERGGVTHQLSLSGGGMQRNGPAEEQRATTMRLLEKVERMAVWGREDIVDENGETVAFNGIIPQMEADAATQVIDLEGAVPDYDTLEDVAERMVTTGKLMDLDGIVGWTTPGVMRDYARLARTYQRAEIGAMGLNAVVPGTPFKGFQTQYGFLGLEQSLLLEEVNGNQPLATPDSGALAATGGVAGAADADTTSKLAAATYYYFVSTINNKGESDTTASAGVAILADERAAVTITRVAGASGYRVYRSLENDAATAYWVGTIGQPASGNAVFLDRNQYRPNTGVMLFYHADEADIVIPQLAPLTKFPLAVTSTTMEYLLLLYLTLVVKAHERVVVVKNVGRA